MYIPLIGHLLLTQNTHGVKAQKFLQAVKESQMEIPSTTSLAVHFAVL